MPSIEVQIKVDHYDGRIEIHRDDSMHARLTDPTTALKQVVACAEASAIAAMKAKAER